MYRTALLILCALVLSNCSLPSKQEFEKIQAMLNRSADLRRAVNTECIEMVAAQPRKTRENGATYMNVSLGQMPSTFCKRMLGAMATGRFTVVDLETIRKTKKPTANLVKILKGQ